MKTDYTHEVWRHSKSKGKDLLVLLALSEQADKDGQGGWNASSTESARCMNELRTIATMCRTTCAAISRSVSRLIEAGELEVSTREGQLGTYYQVLPRLPLDEEVAELPVLEEMLMTMAEWQEFQATIYREFPMD